MKIKTLGALMCFSSCGIMKPERVKAHIDKLAQMGYNYLELCTDDTYKIEEEPYFGYLRGGYTKDEIKDMDAYAKSKGIELVPCVQTLAHQTNLVKLPHYADIVDIDNILLVDEPKTYELIENMFKTLRECYSTDKVNIGFDEAHKIGRGRFLDKFGYQDRFEILLRHLNRVVDIAKKYGFKVHMWSDMFFRLAFDGRYEVKDAVLPDIVKEKIPEGVALTMWAHPEDAEVFDSMITSHEQIGRELWITLNAGKSSNGYAPFNKLCIEEYDKYFKYIEKHGVENLFFTLWDDENNECPYDNAIVSLYTASQYAKGNFDMVSIKKGFKEMFGVEFDDIMLHDLPNKYKSNPDLTKFICACKTMLFNDCFVGWKDSMIERELPIDYDEMARTLEDAVKRTGEYSYITDMYAKLCRALEYKHDLGLRTRKAYKAGDKAELGKLVGRYEECAKRIKIFKDAFRKNWMYNNKPYNWEVHEIRLGGLISRVMDCRDRLIEYLDGRVDCIPELNETILPYAEWGLQYNLYKGLVTLNEL